MLPERPAAGPPPGAKPDPPRFDGACEKAYAPAARHFAELAAQRKLARKQREDFIAAAAAHAPTLLAVEAERAVSRALGGSCTVPLGAYAEVSGNRLWLRALVASPDGRRIVRAEARGALAEPEALGQSVASELRRGGATEILAALVPAAGGG